MEYHYFHKLQEKVQSSCKYIFEPTVNIFKNGIVINHQKVGTRFIQELAAGNSYTIQKNNQQVQFIFLDSENNGDYTLNPIKYHFKNRYVLSPWYDDGKSFSWEGYPEWKTDESFLKSQGYDNYTDFFFNNKKDFIFIIRNPIHRFFSGVIQILSVNEKEVTIEEFGETLRENWQIILSDIHTVNYLEHYKEMIYNIKDKSKIKIVDLSQLKTQKACDMFCDLRGDDISREIYKNINEKIDSNRETYSKLYKLYEDVETDDSIFIQYIKSEYNTYQELKDSPYFLDIS